MTRIEEVDVDEQTNKFDQPYVHNTLQTNHILWSLPLFYYTTL